VRQHGLPEYCWRPQNSPLRTQWPFKDQWHNYVRWRWRRQHGLPKCCYPMTSLHSVITQKTKTWISFQAPLTSPWRMRQHGPPKHWYPTTLLYSVITQKTSTWKALCYIWRWALNQSASWTFLGNKGEQCRKFYHLNLTADTNCIHVNFQTSLSTPKGTLLRCYKDLLRPSMSV